MNGSMNGSTLGPFPGYCNIDLGMRLYYISGMVQDPDHMGLYILYME